MFFLRILTLSVVTAAPCLHAQQIDNSATSRARSMLTSGEPAKVRAVIRSFQDDYQGGMDIYKNLLVEAKRAIEPRFDSAVNGQPMTLSPAEKQLEALLVQRLMVQAQIPAMPDDPFDPAAFKKGMETLVKMEAACADLFMKQPEAAKMLMKPVAPALEESLELINSELTRFYPKDGLWITLKPLGGTFRGATLRERKLRLDGYLGELRERPGAHAEAKEYFKDRPVALASLFVQIQRNRQALGLRPIRPLAPLTDITRAWADETFALVEIPKEKPPTAESDLEKLANAKKIPNWIRHVVTVPLKSTESASWEMIAAEAHLVSAFMDPAAIHVGIADFPSGVVLVLAEEAEK